MHQISLTRSNQYTRQELLPETGEEARPPISLATRITMLAAVILPFVGLVAAIAFIWGWGFSWVELALFFGMYALTALGITVGYHRLFTHRSFETHPIVQAILAILGSMAVQGPLLMWVAIHRRHHQYSDKKDDPHSPHHRGAGVLGVLAGMWHAHIGWMFHSAPDLNRYVRDLRQSTLLRVVHRLFPVWVVAGLALPALIGFVLSGDYRGAVLGFLWGGLARVFFVHHTTWSVNSICHLWGQQPFQSADESRNNIVVGILALGEGWHNNHHAFPTSARHGLRWWQIDASYMFIRTLALLGLAWNLKLPAQHSSA